MHSEMRMSCRRDAKSPHRPNPTQSGGMRGGLACDPRDYSFVRLRKETFAPNHLFSSRRDQCATNGKVLRLSCVTAPAGHANKTRSRFLCHGRERPHELFGRLKAEKVGSLPPNLVFFPVSVFSFSCRLFPRFPETYAHPKLKKMEKTKLKEVIPTFFICSPRFTPREPNETTCWAGATHESLWPRNRVQKWGRLQPNTGFCPRPN